MPPTRHSTEVSDEADSRPATEEAQPGGGSKTPPTRHRPEVCAGADSRLATDEASPEVAGGRRRRGTAGRCTPEMAAELPPTRHSPKVRAECGSRTPPTRHSPEACAGTGSRAATDAAQPEGMRRMRQQGAADEAQPGGVRWNRQQSLHRCGTASRRAPEPAAEPPPTRHSPEVCAGDGSRAATDAAQPRGVRWSQQQGRRRRGTASRWALEPAAEPPPTRHSLEACAVGCRKRHQNERSPWGAPMEKSEGLDDEGEDLVESCLLTKTELARRDT